MTVKGDGKKTRFTLAFCFAEVRVKKRKRISVTYQFAVELRNTELTSVRLPPQFFLFCFVLDEDDFEFYSGRLP